MFTLGIGLKTLCQKYQGKEWSVQGICRPEEIIWYIWQRDPLGVTKLLGEWFFTKKARHVRVGTEDFKWFSFRVGFCLGYEMPLWLFNVYEQGGEGDKCKGFRVRGGSKVYWGWEVNQKLFTEDMRRLLERTSGRWWQSLRQCERRELGVNKDKSKAARREDKINIMEVCLNGEDLK